MNCIEISSKLLVCYENLLIQEKTKGIVKRREVVQILQFLHFKVNRPEG